MVYMKHFYDEDEWFEVDRKTALKTLLQTYKDNAEVRGWLNEENHIQCQFSEIKVLKEKEVVKND